MERFLALGACLGLSACATPWSLGGQEFDDNVDEGGTNPNAQDSPEDTDAGAVVDTSSLGAQVYLSGVSCDDAPTVSPLVATGGVGRIDVDHGGVYQDCNAEWRLSASADAANLRVDAWYSPSVPEASDCHCYWRFQYGITPLVAGSWTLGVQGGTAIVDVQ